MLRVRVIALMVWLSIGSVALAGEPLDTLQPLFVSGEQGYGRYRIPALIASPKGTLLAFCEGRRKAAGLTGDIDLVLRRSFDDGKTWEPQQLVADDGPNTLGNPCPVVDRTTGMIWLPFTRSLGQDTEQEIIDGTSDGVTTVWITKSADDGATWSTPVEISATTRDPSWTWYGNGPGIGVQLADGRLLIPSYHAERGTKIYRSHAVYSDDHGATWQRGATVGEHTAECQAIVRRDGQVVLNMRGTNKQGVRTLATSRDGGKSWSTPALDTNLPEPACQAALFDYSRSGEPSRWLFSNPPGPGRSKLTLRLSRDEGQTWPLAKMLDAVTTEYSCLARLADGSIGCLYERSPGKTYSVQICFIRCSLEWLER